MMTETSTSDGSKEKSTVDAGLASPQDSLLAFGVEYYFPDREFSIGLDYGLARSKNSGLAYQEGRGAALQDKSVKGDWQANLYGLGMKWHWDKIGSGIYAGYYLRDGDANTFNYKKQTMTVGIDKRFAVSKYNSLILFVETAYDDARSDNPAYKKIKNKPFWEQVPVCLFKQNLIREDRGFSHNHFIKGHDEKNVENININIGNAGGIQCECSDS
ncbi:hypothetical protein ABLA30_06785 [Xenorhabdus nematophila]|nr:hypothetical protein [Xenorhabdus nematophila]CCW32878.1 hypothetical protein XNC3_870025 [Xenorhabdus nematophila F1]